MINFLNKIKFNKWINLLMIKKTFIEKINRNRQKILKIFWKLITLNKANKFVWIVKVNLELAQCTWITNSVQTALKSINLLRKRYNRIMAGSRFKLRDQEKYILTWNVRISIPGKSKCILGKLRAGANLAKRNRGPRPYECNKKLMKGPGRHN